MTQASKSMTPKLEHLKKYPIITIDGPSGAGKGTVCLRLANALGYKLLDSGALYRIVGLKAHQQGLIDHNSQVDNLDEHKITELTQALDIRFLPYQKSMRIVVDGVEVGQKIRNETVGGYASKVATLPMVREALLDLQRNMANESGLVADGRDMGTVVFPNADVKIFLTASAQARAQRRVAQLEQVGEMANYADILTVIQDRDERDENRDVSPSRPALDALVLDTSTMDAENVFAKVKQYCQRCGISF